MHPSVAIDKGALGWRGDDGRRRRADGVGGHGASPKCSLGPKRSRRVHRFDPQTIGIDEHDVDRSPARAPVPSGMRARALAIAMACELVRLLLVGGGNPPRTQAVERDPGSQEVEFSVAMAGYVFLDDGRHQWSIEGVVPAEDPHSRAHEQLEAHHGRYGVAREAEHGNARTREHAESQRLRRSDRHLHPPHGPCTQFLQDDAHDVAVTHTDSTTGDDGVTGEAACVRTSTSAPSSSPTIPRS